MYIYLYAYFIELHYVDSQDNISIFILICKYEKHIKYAVLFKNKCSRKASSTCSISIISE